MTEYIYQDDRNQNVLQTKKPQRQFRHVFDKTITYFTCKMFYMLINAVLISNIFLVKKCPCGKILSGVYWLGNFFPCFLRSLYHIFRASCVSGHFTCFQTAIRVYPQIFTGNNVAAFSNSTTILPFTDGMQGSGCHITHPDQFHSDIWK